MIAETYGPLVYVVVLNYNGLKYLGPCLRSLCSQSYGHFHTLLLDNGSTDGSQAYLRQTFPEVELVENDRNLGIAGGRNVGFQIAKDRGADYVAFLDNDAEADPSWLTALVRAAETDEGVGICGSKVLLTDRKTIEQVGGILAPSVGVGMNLLEKDHGQHDEPANVAFAAGCSMLVRMKITETLGFFDEDLNPHSQEDVDYGLRAWMAGYRVLYVPDSVIYHHSQTIVTRSAARTLEAVRGPLTMVLRDYQFRTILKFWKPLVWLYILPMRRDPVCRRAFFINLRLLPRTIRQRSINQRMRRVTDAEIFAQIQYKHSPKVVVPVEE